MIFDHDLFCQALIYPEGDDLLGGWFENWQVNGILFYHPQVDSISAKGLVGEYVNLHDPVFPSALRQWLEKRNFYSLAIPHEAWDAWNYIQDLPLDDSEKFSISQNLACAKPNELESLQKSLLNLRNAMEKETKKVSPKLKTKSVSKKTTKNKVKLKK